MVNIEDLTRKSVLQMALIAISSRIVGSAFRCLETLNPQFKTSNVGSDPKTVCLREMSTIGMAFVLALLTGKLITPWATGRGWGSNGIQFVTTIISTAIAESIGRIVAYRKLYQQQRNVIIKQDQLPTVINTTRIPCLTQPTVYRPTLNTALNLSRNISFPIQQL